MNILTTYFTASCLFTFLREGMMHAEFNSVVLSTILYSRFKHCAKDVSKVTAQRTVLEFNKNYKICTKLIWSCESHLFLCDKIFN